MLFVILLLTVVVGTPLYLDPLFVRTLGLVAGADTAMSLRLQAWQHAVRGVYDNDAGQIRKHRKALLRLCRMLPDPHSREYATCVRLHSLFHSYSGPSALAHADVLLPEDCKASAGALRNELAPLLRLVACGRALAAPMRDPGSAPLHHLLTNSSLGRTLWHIRAVNAAILHRELYALLPIDSLEKAADEVVHSLQRAYPQSQLENLLTGFWPLRHACSACGKGWNVNERIALNPAQEMAWLEADMQTPQLAWLSCNLFPVLKPGNMRSETMMQLLLTLKSRPADIPAQDLTTLEAARPFVATVAYCEALLHKLFQRVYDFSTVDSEYDQLYGILHFNTVTAAEFIDKIITELVRRHHQLS